MHKPGKRPKARPKATLPKVLGPKEDVLFVYKPELGFRGSEEEARERLASKIKSELKRVSPDKLKEGDLVYYNPTRHVSLEGSHDRESFSLYVSDRYYLCKVVREGNRLLLETLTRMPAAPAASRRWQRMGARLPIEAMDEKRFFKPKNKPKKPA